MKKFIKFNMEKMTIPVSWEDFYECSEVRISTLITSIQGDKEKNYERQKVILCREIVVVKATIAGKCTFTKFNIFSLKYQIRLLWA